MVLRVLAITALLNVPLALVLAPPMIAAALAQGLSAFGLVRSDQNGENTNPPLAHKNPFRLGEVLRFGALLAVVIFAAEVARQKFGEGGLLTVAALSGLADVDAMTLSAARMSGDLSGPAHAILLAVAVNTAAKTVYSWYAGGNRLGLMLAAFNAGAVAIGGAALYLLGPVLSP